MMIKGACRRIADCVSFRIPDRLHGGHFWVEHPPWAFLRRAPAGHKLAPLLKVMGKVEIYIAKRAQNDFLTIILENCYECQSGLYIRVHNYF